MQASPTVASVELLSTRTTFHFVNGTSACRHARIQPPELWLTIATVPRNCVGMRVPFSRQSLALVAVNTCPNGDLFPALNIVSRLTVIRYTIHGNEVILVNGRAFSRHLPLSRVN